MTPPGESKATGQAALHRREGRVSILTRARAAVRAFVGEPTTRWPTWALRPSPARMALAERYRDSTRSAFLVSSVPVAATIAEVYRTSLIGDGPSVRSAHPNLAYRRACEAEWARFYKRACAEGLGDLALFLIRVVATLVMAGEAFIHMEVTEDGHLQVRLLSPEQIDPTMNRALPGGGQIVAGIEFDAAGRRVAYWVRENPDSLLMPLALPPIRIPASDILHVFEPPFPGSVRGRSWLASVAQTIIELHKIQDSLAARLGTASLFSAYVTDTEGGIGGFDDATRTGDRSELSLEPGVVRILPPGTEITFPTLPGTEGADALVQTMFRQIAQGVGIPPFMLTGDYGSINYSAGKLGLETFKRRVTAIRSSLLTAQLIEPLWQRVVTLAILSGRIYAPDFATRPDDYFTMTAMWPGFAALDPYREAQADVLLMRAGLRSRAEIIEARGRDVADVDAEIAADTIAPDLTAISFSGEQNAAA